jgi:luciferase family oxidoreductase group 1
MLEHLSILDQSNAVEGVSHQTIIQQTVELAQHAEACGYSRFWVSEHHSHPSVVGTAPEILLAALSQKTHKIRLGSAGVMLPHYSAFKVAEQFRVLESLAPGRIDLGVGRAPGSDMRTAQLLNPNPQSAAYFPQQVQELDLWVRNETFPAGHPGRGIPALPVGDTFPDLWILGSSDYGAQLAAHLGLPYVFAYFITDGEGAKQALDLYHELFRPSARLQKPKAIICVWALAAEHDEEAYFQFRSRARWKMDRQKGLLRPLQKPEQALDSLSNQEMNLFEKMCQEGFVGSSSKVIQKLSDLAQSVHVNEIAVITSAHDFSVRKKSFTLLAEEIQSTVGASL